MGRNSNWRDMVLNREENPYKRIGTIGLETCSDSLFEIKEKNNNPYSNEQHISTNLFEKIGNTRNLKMVCLSKEI